MKNKLQLDLFSEKMDIRITKITRDDVNLKTDKFKQFTDVLIKHETMYPDINKWFKDKVIQGIRNGERVAYLGYKNDNPLVTAIVKKGQIAKFCHLHIDKELRDIKLGELFFSMMSVDIRNIAKSVYFTLPESLWIEKREFFKSFGFDEFCKSEIQYRSFEEELKSFTSFNILWEKVREKLPAMISSLTPSNENIFTGLLMSVKPAFIEKIESGEKVIEIRRKFNPKWRRSRITLYSTSPSSSLYGHAMIDEVYKGEPNDIWERFGSEIGCKKKEYDEYTASAEQIYAIRIINFESYLSPIFLNHISHLIKTELKPPQSYLSIENNKGWTEAISLAELLHGRFQLYLSTI